MGARCITTRIPGGASPIILPDSLSGLELWLRADEANQTAGGSAAVADGDPVGDWVDKSGNGRNYQQGVSLARPTLRLNAINGKPEIDFDGVDDFLFGTGTNFSSSSYETFVVVKGDISSNNPHFLGMGTGLGGWFPFGTDIYCNFGSSSRYNGPHTDALNQWGLYQVQSAAGSWDGKWRGDVFASSGTNTVAMQTMLNSRIGNNGFAGFDGRIAEVIIYGRILTTNERATVESYIANRYGILT